MPESMTGYGVGRATTAELDVSVELRSVNHRHLDLRVKLPSGLQALQSGVTAQLRAALDRGHVEARVHVTEDRQTSQRVQVDAALANELKSALEQLATETGLTPPENVKQLVNFPGVLRVESRELAADAVKPLLTEACAAAIEQLVEHRLSEGAVLAQDLTARVERLQQIHSQLQTLAPQVLAALRERLKARVEEALSATQLDPARFEQEMVILSDKSDITEELVRLAGHLGAAHAALSERCPGKRLGFLAQEVLREFNTIGSKSNSLEVTEKVVAAKVELEKFREQVLNLA